MSRFFIPFFFCFLFAITSIVANGQQTTWFHSAHSGFPPTLENGVPNVVLLFTHVTKTTSGVEISRSSQIVSSDGRGSVVTVLDCDVSLLYNDFFRIVRPDGSIATTTAGGVLSYYGSSNCGVFPGRGIDIQISGSYMKNSSLNGGPDDRCPKPSVGLPVNVTTGNMWIHQSDYKIGGSIRDLSIDRTYNSVSRFSGIFGYGWSSGIDLRLKADSSGFVQIDFGNGKLAHFIKKVGSSTDFETVTQGLYAQLVQQGNEYQLKMKDGRLYRFSSGGLLLWKKDRNQNQTIFSYDNNNLLTSMTDVFGRTLSFTSNSNGTISGISDSLGVIASYEYIINTNFLKSVTYPDGSKYKFEYASVSGDMYLSTVKDALDNILETHQYDSTGRAITSEKHGGVEKYTFDYTNIDAYVRYTSATDAENRVSKYYFNTSRGGNVIEKTEGICGCGGNTSQIMSYEYDNQLNKTKKTDGNGNTMTMTYDANGNMLTETNPTGTKIYTYNTYGQVLTETDQMGGVTTVVYDTNGKPTQIKDALNNSTNFTYNPKGQILTATDARNKTTAYTWTNADLTKIKDANLKETNFVYDARSRLTSTTNALNYTASYQYDLVNRLKKVTFPDTNFQEFTYDLAGRRTQVKDARGNITNLSYDNAYRLISVTDALNHTTNFNYDLMSNQISTTDAQGKVTNTEYDEFNRVKKVIYPEITVGGTRLNEQFQYDQVGNLKKQIDTASRETLFDYDTANRLIKTTDALLNITQFEYNARSQRTKVRDALNQEYVFTFDALGRQLSQTRAVSTMSYQFDAVGNRTKRTDYIGRVTTYEYDNLNRLNKINYLIDGNNSAIGNAVTYNYDDLSRLTSAINENGTVSFTYDSRNRTTSTTDVFGHLITYAYDANSNRTAMTLDGQPHSGYQYDVVNRLTTLSDESSSNFIFLYDIANKLITQASPTPNTIVTSYTYDGMNRLSRLKHQGTTLLADSTYSYNSGNQISNIAGLSQTKNFGYDNVDRLTSVTGSTSENYIFDSVGNRTSSSQSAGYAYQPFNRVSSTNTANYKYNANGSMTSKSEGSNFWRYSWDYENRMFEASTRRQKVRYRYDALGRRIRRYLVGNKENTKFTYDGQDVILDDNNGVLIRYQNGPGIDNKLKMVTGAVHKYFIKDHLGSTIGVANNSGNLSEQTSYDSFGNATSNLSTRYQFTGREYDNFTGLHYYRARFYDAKLGRFISEDPIGFSGGDVNLYGYVHNNPVSKIDPLGLLDTGIYKDLSQTAQQTAPAITGGIAAGGTILAYGGTSVTAAPAVAVGTVIVGGLATGYAIGYYPGQYIARKLYPEQFPETQTQRSPQNNDGEKCDLKPLPVPNLSATPRPFTPPNEPKRTCTLTGSFVLPTTGMRRCTYACRGGGFPGSYVIATDVPADAACPLPDANDNDWIPGGY
jgi:RHS repeat-associated protein